MNLTLEKTISLSNPEIHWRYESGFKDILFGQVLEDLDLIAATLAGNYAAGPVVTAALEQLDFHHQIDMQKDLLCKAAVNTVGKSSLEVGVRLENDREHIASTYFTFVAIDTQKGKPRAIASYTPTTPDQIRRNEEAKARKENYLHRQQQREQPLTAEERELLAQAQGVHGEHMYRGANLIFMRPQQKNIHNTIFGGYLMHAALELAEAAVYEYSGKRAALASINRINFLRPVQIGALLRMHKTICYIGNTSVQVEILFEEVHGKNSQPITNSCYFAFVGVDDDFKPQQMPKVIPANEEENYKYIEGRRRYLENKTRLRK